MHRLLEKLDKEIHKYADKEGELTSAEWKCVFEALEARYYLLVGMGMTGEDASGNYSNQMSDRRYPYYSDMYRDYSDRGNMGRGRNYYSGTDYSMNESTEQMRMQLQNMMKQLDSMNRH